MTSTSSQKSSWRAPRWLLIISYAATILVPFFGQIVGFVLGLALVILPHRRVHGVLLVVLSLLMLLVWLLISVSAGGGGAFPG